MNPATLAPSRTHEQRMESLMFANRIRVDRAVMKRQIAAGTVTVLEILSEPPRYAWSMRVLDLLCSQRGMGPAKARPILRGLQISPVKTVAGLSERQRLALVEALT